MTLSKGLQMTVKLEEEMLVLLRSKHIHMAPRAIVFATPGRWHRQDTDTVRSMGMQGGSVCELQC